jgi:hypothetical protein
MEKVCETYGFRKTSPSIARLRSQIPNPATIEEKITALVDSFKDEMQSFVYLQIADTDVPLWEKEKAFGEHVWERFKSARDDVEEAAKCLALHRWTSSAFHCLRVQEIGMNAMYQALCSGKLPQGGDRTWGKVLEKIENEIWSRKKSKKPEWETWTPPMETALSFLRQAKDLWRDDTMHVGPKKDDKEAKRIYDATRLFIQHLADWINDEGIFQKQ